jgi:hypothetical protein
MAADWPFRYSEEEIRKAWRKATREIERSDKTYPKTIDTLMDILKGGNGHVHDFADTDTVTVKELQEAEQRLRRPGSSLSSFSTGKLLRDISEHREPYYAGNTIVKDADNRVWKMSPNRKWLRVEWIGVSNDDQPVRPLRVLREEA